MLSLKATIRKVVCIVIGLSAGAGASYLLVVKGLRLPAGVLGLVGAIGLFWGAGYNCNDVTEPENFWMPGNAFHEKDSTKR